jgi:pantoate--beta-alanine ligase
MGAIHNGHLSLLRHAILETDISVCSIFVNPAQFNNREDYINYPARITEDLQLLESTGCDCVFVPDEQEIYGGDHANSLQLYFGHLETVCEGKFRNGHFKGVGLIVAKLFNIISPDVVYFGQKDLQQVAVINKLISDLSFNILLRRVPTVREPDGLALSSRNLRIAPEDRPGAVKFYQTLLMAKELLIQGTPVQKIRQDAEKFFDNDPVNRLEYLELVDFENFSEIGEYKGQHTVAFCISGYTRNIRLIDNILIKE